MPFTVVTLSKSPPSLRGDLSKWMQEIAPGVYVGNFNTKVREELWTRILDSVKSGEATMSYAFRNEIGYNFITHNTESQVIDYDGIPLVMFPAPVTKGDKDQRTGFSDVSKRRKARFFTSKEKAPQVIGVKDFTENYQGMPFAVIDIETDGLNPENHRIIEIGAVKVENGTMQDFSCLIKCDARLPEEIVQLTGITNEILDREGIAEEEALYSLMAFLGDAHLVGYNIKFDIGFIRSSMQRLKIGDLKTNVVDLMKFVKAEKMFLDDYKLQTVLKSYDISDEVPHRALPDAKLILKLSLKLTKFQSLIK